jgi:predicted RecB family nuclease
VTQHGAVTDRLLTPSKITAFLDCGHYLTLRHRLEMGLLEVRGGGGSMAKLLMEKGLAHEKACLAEYRARGRTVCEVPGKNRGERFSDWVARVGNPMADGYDVIYQMPFVHDGVRGVADFLVRITGEDGIARYEPVDAKLARTEAKPGHILQLCFYADAIEALTGVAPINLHVWLGSGRVETVRLTAVHAYWRRLRRQLVAVMETDPSTSATLPEKCDHCAFCEFSEVCEAEWRSQDSLLFVANILKADRAALIADDRPTLAALAACVDLVPGIRPERQERLVTQASLQLQTRSATSSAPPVRFQPVVPGEGFLALPQPDEGDVVLDFEGHPFWQADVGLFFLFGVLTRETASTWAYEPLWAHDRLQEAQCTKQLIEYLEARRLLYPGMHVYHYNHTERSSLERLALEHHAGEFELAELVETGLFVDLFRVVTKAMQIGVESYGLKSIELLTSFERSHDIDQGAGAVVEYDAYCNDRDQTRLTRIARYNEDDVRATLALRDWLVTQRPAELPWRSAVLPPAIEAEKVDDLVDQLRAFGPGTPEYLAGDMTGYWRRERKAAVSAMMGLGTQDTSELLLDPNAITGLIPLGGETLLTPTGRPGKHPGMRFRFPDQEVSADFDPAASRGANVMYSCGDAALQFAEIVSLDAASREVVLRWKEVNAELGITPTTVVLDTWVSPRPKPDAFKAFAVEVAGCDPAASARTALLRRDLPNFASGSGPLGGHFTDGLREIMGWAPHLQNSCVSVQGPPGTGKTYTGAHIVHALVRSGRRVGITAMSHAAIDNLLAQTSKVFEKEGHLSLLRAVRRGKAPVSGALAGVRYTDRNGDAASPSFRIVAGTTWLFAGRDMQDAPVDVLLIDEAGQLSLADTLAASGSARNIILLGDPLQLGQVTQACHPDGSGVSVLQHILGPHVTMPTDRGVFLSETWRMHPDICAFISEQIYEGRLTHHPSCAVQGTSVGTGLRWLQAHHSGCSTESEVEAAMVVDGIAALIGQTWTNAEGVSRPLDVDDFMVVAPYNDQVRRLRQQLDGHQRTVGVRVGTVDKFQGQEAPVVFFSMTASSSADIPRGIDFLFSKNRLNVAISRARALAYLVCTEDLLNSRARTVAEMELIGTLCAFVERCTTIQ